MSTEEKTKLKYKQIVDNLLLNLTTKEMFNYLFKYLGGELFIKNKWSMNAKIDKKVKDACLINKIRFKKEDIIWIMHFGDIPSGCNITQIDKDEKFKIENLQCLKYKHNNGRPFGVKDKEKRSTKSFLTVDQERYIRDNWFDYSTKHFVEKLNVTHGMVMGARRELKLPVRLQRSRIVKKCDNINLLKEKIGIYGIVTSDKKMYIGSSVNIFNRIRVHLNLLNNNNHWNKSLQASWSGKTYYGIIEECDEQDLIDRENYYIKNTTNIHNTWLYKSITEDQIDYFKEKILNKIKITNSGCWEYTGSIDKAGYGQLSVLKCSKKIAAHRLMYFANNLNANQNVIVRHTCNNKKCCNPDHLKSGSYRDNSLDYYECRAVQMSVE